MHLKSPVISPSVTAVVEQTITIHICRCGFVLAMLQYWSRPLSQHLCACFVACSGHPKVEEADTCCCSGCQRHDIACGTCVNCRLDDRQDLVARGTHCLFHINAVRRHQHSSRRHDCVGLGSPIGRQQRRCLQGYCENRATCDAGDCSRHASDRSRHASDRRGSVHLGVVCPRLHLPLLQIPQPSAHRFPVRYPSRKPQMFGKILTASCHIRVSASIYDVVDHSTVPSALCSPSGRSEGCGRVVLPPERVQVSSYDKFAPPQSCCGSRVAASPLLQLHPGGGSQAEEAAEEGPRPSAPSIAHWQRGSTTLRGTPWSPSGSPEAAPGTEAREPADLRLLPRCSPAA